MIRRMAAWIGIHIRTGSGMYVMAQYRTSTNIYLPKHITPNCVWDTVEPGYHSSNTIKRPHLGPKNVVLYLFRYD
jgi:hypothetical protein